MPSSREELHHVADALHAPHRLWRRGIQELERVLAVPQGFPCDPTLSKLARDFLTARDRVPATPVIGETAIVSVARDRDGARGAIWVLRASPGGRPFVQQAAVARDRATLVARRSMPVLVEPTALRDGADWSAHPLFGDTRERALDGRSFELSMCLAEISRLIGRPIRSGVMATATVEPGDRLGLVDEIECKARTIARGALGVHTILVAKAPTDRPDLYDHVRAAIREEGREDLALTEVETLAEAVEHAFLLRDALANRELVPAGGAARWIDELFALALRGAMLDWRSVVTAAALAAGELAGDSQRSWKAQVTIAIASRHHEEGTLIEWPSDQWLIGIPRSARLALVAHLVQSASDCEPSRVPEYVERATGHVASTDQAEPSDLILCGAIGRAWAAIGRYDESLDWLRRAVTGWTEHAHWSGAHAWSQASHPLCELARVLGIRGAREELIAFEHNALPQIIASAGPGGYLHLAFGRAFVQTGAPAHAIERYLNDRVGVAWCDSPDHVSASRLRWLARALDAVGDHAAADAQRHELAKAAASAFNALEQNALATLDVAIAGRGDLDVALAGLTSPEAKRTVVRVSQGLLERAVAIRVAEEFRY